MMKRNGRLLVLLVLLATALVVDWRIAQARPPMGSGPAVSQSPGVSKPVLSTDSGDPDSGGTIRDPGTTPATRLSKVPGGRHRLRWFERTSRIWATWYMRVAF
jgi:hypothetical protein